MLLLLLLAASSIYIFMNSHEIIMLICFLFLFLVRLACFGWCVRSFETFLNTANTTRSQMCVLLLFFNFFLCLKFYHNIERSRKTGEYLSILSNASRFMLVCVRRGRKKAEKSHVWLERKTDFLIANTRSNLISVYGICHKLSSRVNYIPCKSHAHNYRRFEHRQQCFCT